MPKPPAPPLPIDAVLGDVCAALAHAPACVVQAPPGAGKTTRVPLALFDAGFAERGQIVLLEPRRVAARAAALALARGRGERVGDSVGYKVRFEEVASRDTRIMVVTEGILTRRLIHDPLLEGVSVVILDEIHERSVHSDLALAFLREICEVRDDLKVVAMSATLDARAVSQFLFDAPIVSCVGRPFPVDVRHIAAGDRGDARLEEQVTAGLRDLVLAKDDDGGDVLVFLPGAPEINRVAERLAARPLPGNIETVPLYGALSSEAQDRAIAKGEGRRVILATNVAETSLTLPGVSAVLDSGLVKLARHDNATDRSYLDTVRISLASAEQRTGRAGRLRPGRCLRLWTTAEHNTLQANHAPELLRADLVRVLLDVVAFHPGHPAAFAFFERPNPAALERAVRTLIALFALTPDGTRLTERGKSVAALPLHPRTATLLLDAGMDAEEVALEAAILEDERIHPRDAAARTTDSDVAELALSLPERGAGRDVWRARQDLLRHVRRERVGDGSRTQAYVSAYLDRLCKRRRAGEPEARMVGGRGVKLGRESGVHDAELFFALVMAGQDKSAARVTLAEATSLDVIARHRPDAVRVEETAVFDSARGTLMGVRRTWVLDLLVDEKTGLPLPPGAAGGAVAQALAADLSLLKLGPEVLQLRARLRVAAQHLPQVNWPDASDDGVRVLLPDACSSVRSIEQARALNWPALLLAPLSFADRKLLDEEVPERVAVPSGSMISLDYSPVLAGAEPVLAVRLQELFGLAETPRIARGAVALVLHLLSPGYKPVQVTRDLRSFWSGTYADVKKELKARYPKHHWPDDPWTATPTARAKRRPHS